MIKTQIIKIKGDWKEILNDCRATMGKTFLNKEPSETFKKKILISEHSPIRDISFKWIWENIPHWVGVHWVRHKWECFVKSQRTDRTGIPREELTQIEPQDFIGEMNIQNGIDTMRKRLCRQASPQTRHYAENLKCAVTQVDPFIGDVFVPNCVYRCGCPEIKNCGFFDMLIEKTEKNILTSDIQERYNLYNNWFYEHRHNSILK